MIDMIDYHFDDARRALGKKVIDYDEQYEKLLKVKSQVEAGYKAGEIPKEKYDEVMNRLAELGD